MKKTTPTIIGTIIGDVVGSRFEWKNIKTTEFEMMHENCMMTDDTILTIAVADAILQGKPYGDFIYQYGNSWPGFGYGGNFRKYLASPSPKPYGSYGNGSAIRSVLSDSPLMILKPCWTRPGSLPNARITIRKESRAPRPLPVLFFWRGPAAARLKSESF